MLEGLPERQVVLDLAIFGADAQHSWLLLAPDTEPTLCLEDPMRDQDRYLCVEADAAALFPIARGARGWTEAMTDGSVQVYGDPELVRDTPGWFRAAEVATPASVAAAVA